MIVLKSAATGCFFNRAQITLHIYTLYVMKAYKKGINTELGVEFRVVTMTEVQYKAK